jgi:hypothetical protein
MSQLFPVTCTYIYVGITEGATETTRNDMYASPSLSSLAFQSRRAPSFYFCCSECDVRELLTVASSGNYGQYYVQCSVSLAQEKQLDGTELLLDENG